MPITTERVQALDQLCRRFRREVLTAISGAQSGHCGGSLSACEILTTIYQEKASLDPTRPTAPDRDRVVLSKGHAAPMQYINLAYRGYFPMEDLGTLRRFGSHLQGHPSYHTPGVDIPSGPLGIGLGAAVGMAMGLRLQNNPARVYCVMGDGELDEGVIWESAMTAAKYHVDNLTAVVDFNKVQLDGTVEDIMPLGDLCAKWAAFGWNVLRCDGHDIAALSGAMDAAAAHKDQPTVIVADTIKGKGVSFMEGKNSWHGAVLSPENLALALKELEEQGMSKAIRDIYGETLAELGNTMPNLVVLDADVANSTKSGIFRDAHPDRFFDVGIAESNMAAMAAGMATTGLVPFINTFAVFITEVSLLAVRGQICYGNLNVKLGGAYSGMSDALDGATHHALEDIANMRALPNMRILSVCDAAQTRWATTYAAQHDGPFYLRLSRDSMPDLYAPDHAFTFGKAEVLHEGSDAVLIATGLCVHNALVAAEQLAAEGISCAVYDMHTIKPIDCEAVLTAAKTGTVVTCEEHNIYGGLGSAVAEVMAEAGCPANLTRVGVHDSFSETGSYAALQTKYGIDAGSIADAVKRSLNRV